MPMTVCAVLEPLKSWPAVNPPPPPETVQELPKVQVVLLIEIEEFARAEFGIALAATERAGVLVGFVTDGTNHVGQEAEAAVNVVTVPDPPPPPVPKAVHVFAAEQ
jgi:hypothetical protein